MSSSHLDFSDPEVYDTLKDVLNDKTPTNWTLFTYAPRSSKLKLEASGEGNVEELASEVSDGKIYFGYLRREMSETFKFLFINWCGDGVTGTMKGYFQVHTQDFLDYLKKNNFPVAAQINARQEKDLDESEIIKALNKTSTFIRARSTKEQPSEALRDKRDQFWKTQSEKDSQHKEELARHQKEKEEELARSKASTSEKLQKEANDIIAEKEARRAAETEAFRAEQDQRNSDQQRKREAQREEVFKDLDSRRVSETRQTDASASQSQGSTYKAPARQAARPAPASEPAPKPAPAKAPASTRAPPPPSREPEPEPEPQPEPEPEPQPEPEPEPQPEPEPEPQPEPEPEPEPQPEPEPEPQAEQPAEAQAVQARALYDYESQEPTDLQFREGDIIVILDQNDPSGWWQGELNGVRGTFPSNFVELI